MCASVPQSEVAATFTTTSWGPGTGSGQLVAVNPGAATVLTSARMDPFYPIPPDRASLFRKREKRVEQPMTDE
jgi:hypothetical protein